MKKVIAVLAVVLLCAGAAFASPAELIGMGGVPVQLTNLDDTALLNPALLGSFANRAIIGIAWPVPSGNPEAQGLVILKAGPGILSIAAGPRSFGSVDMLNTNLTLGNIPDSTFNLGYALDLKGMKAGLSIGYGVDNTFYKNQWAGGAELVGKDEYSTGSSAFKMVAGVALDSDLGLEAALSLGLPGYSYETKDFDNVDNELTNNPKGHYGGMDLALDARATVSEMILALNVTISSLQYQNTAWVDADTNGTPETDSTTTNDDGSLKVNLLAGKIIKATDTLKVTLGSGLKLEAYGAYKSVTENRVADTKTINNTDASNGMTISIPFELAVNVDLGKLWTISNDQIGMSVGISKDVILLDNYNTKTIDPVDESTESLTDHSDLYNTNPVTGAVGLNWKLGDAKVYASAGAAFLDGMGFSPVAAASFVYNWK